MGGGGRTGPDPKRWGREGGAGPDYELWGVGDAGLDVWRVDWDQTQSDGGTGG